MSDRARQPLPYSKRCFVCGRDNPKGLGLRFERQGDVVSATCTLDGHYNGFLGRTHGGIAAALLDEAMGWATVLASHRFTYTVELSVRYKQPVPLEQPLTVRGWLERHTRRLSFAAAELLDGAGQRLVTGEGKFMMVSEQETRNIADALIYDPNAWRVDPSSAAE